MTVYQSHSLTTDISYWLGIKTLSVHRERGKVLLDWVGSASVGTEIEVVYYVPSLY